jgi:hypothetical protein
MLAAVELVFFVWLPLASLAWLLELLIVAGIMSS